MKSKVGVVGNGYVGGAIAHGFSPTATGTSEIRVYDKIPERSLNTLDETVNESDFVFVSVPTPMTKGGSISLKYINDNTDHCLHHYYGEKNYNFSYYFNHWDKLFGTYRNLRIKVPK